MALRVLKVYATEDGPKASTGQPRWRYGAALQLRISNGGMVWVCRDSVGLEAGEAWQGGGLLYTYAAEDVVVLIIVYWSYALF